MAYLRMRRQLSAPIAPAALPPGIVLVPFDRARAQESRELMKRVWSDELGDGGISFDGFWTWLTSDPGYDPELMYVATADGAVVGFCHCWSSGFVKDLAVAPEYRGKGLGAALLSMALTEFARRGAASVDLRTDLDNYGAQSLYARLGFEIVERVDEPPRPPGGGAA